MSGRTPEEAPTAMTTPSTARNAIFASPRKLVAPGVSTMLRMVSFEEKWQTVLLMEILRWISSGSKSEVVLPPMIDPIEGVTPVVYRSASINDVLPAPVEPINATFRMVSTRGSFIASLLDKVALSYASKKRLSTGLKPYCSEREEPRRASHQERTWM